MRQNLAILALGILTQIGLVKGARTKILETDAFITPKSLNRAGTEIGNHLLNLESVIEDDFAESNDVIVENPGEIVTTKDIDNYFNLQITTKVFIGSEQEPHDLILDTGSMVSINQLFCLKDGYDCSDDIDADCFLLHSGHGFRRITAGPVALTTTSIPRRPRLGRNWRSQMVE